jgi:hypothetical protein
MASNDIESRPSQDVENDTPKLSSMPQLARVVGHYDPTFMGRLQVEILRPVGGDLVDGEVVTVDMVTPFYSITSAEYLGGASVDSEDEEQASTGTNDYNNTQKVAGMWFVPPDVGTVVLVLFVNGDSKRGYWYGCVPDLNMNFTLPGYAATKFVDTDTQETTPERVPTGEYNKKFITDPQIDSTKNLKPEHPFAKVLDSQGLLQDDTRGTTTSSARREAPSAVFGISTPGPVDKQEGAQQGPRGTKETLIPNAFVSRLGGSTFVMDDGDDKFLRKLPASDGPPEYASVEQGETDGDVTIPHNELVRIRTRTGHQILLHNSEDLIYITNSRGTAWIEFTSDGKIDIYAKDSISVRTENDINFYADRDINMEAGRNFNLKVAERHQTEVGADKICIVNGNVAIQVDGTHDETITGQTNITIAAGFDLNTGDANNLTSGGDMNISAANTTVSGGNINFNGPAAAEAGTATAPEPLSTFELPTEVDGEVLETILLRVPTTEPYPHHENLDPESFKPDMTDRESAEAAVVPDYWPGAEEVTYSTATDTFAKELPADGEEEQTEEESEE